MKFMLKTTAFFISLCVVSDMSLAENEKANQASAEIIKTETTNHNDLSYQISTLRQWQIQYEKDKKKMTGEGIVNEFGGVIKAASYPLPIKGWIYDFSQLKIGMSGRLVCIVENNRRFVPFYHPPDAKVIQIIDKNTMIVEIFSDSVDPNKHKTVLLKGFSTEGIADGSTFSMPATYTVTGTKQEDKKTYFVIECVKAETPKDQPAEKKKSP